MRHGALGGALDENGPGSRLVEFVVVQRRRHRNRRRLRLGLEEVLQLLGVRRGRGGRPGDHALALQQRLQAHRGPYLTRGSDVDMFLAVRNRAGS